MSSSGDHIASALNAGAVSVSASDSLSYRVQAILAGVEDGIYFKGLDGRYLNVNQTYLTLFGKRLDALIRQMDTAIIPR